MIIGPKYFKSPEKNLDFEKQIFVNFDEASKALYDAYNHGG